MMVKNKSGQIKIQQMAFMLIAVTLFFAIVGLFGATILFSNLKNSAGVLEEKNAMLLVSRLANSPEFSCGDAFGTSRSSCIDLDKAMAVKKDIRKYSESGFWGVKGIEIVRVYPGLGSTGKVVCTQESYPNCTNLEIIKPASGTGISNFVALCRKEYREDRVHDICELGRVIVTYNG